VRGSPLRRDQSIYPSAVATSATIEDFERVSRRENHSAGKNYRSTQNILSAATR